MERIISRLSIKVASRWEIYIVNYLKEKKLQFFCFTLEKNLTNRI
jgi:hypothetical protein